MAAKRITLEIEYTDGRTQTARAGQREMAAWEREPFGCASTTAFDTKPTAFSLYLAFAALKRANELGPQAPSFEDWLDTVEGVELAGAEDVGPTPTGQ